MSNLNSIVSLVHPTVSGVSIVVSDKIWVLFDREMDETTISNGNFFITGPDFDTFTGPDSQLFVEAASAGSGSGDILESPGFEGILQGTITFDRISLTSADTTISGIDTVGSGHLYRTKATFSPTNRLQVNTEYLVHLSGDDDITDSYSGGVSSRTVFDTVSSGSNTSISTPVTGSGLVDFVGGYIGSYPDVYRITITTSGYVGDSKFTFVRDSDPTSIFGPFKTREAGVLLSDCVTAEFEEGLYRTGDQYSAVVKPRDIYAGLLYWPFKTGSGSVQSIPSTTATTVIGDIPASTSTSNSSSSSSLSVSSVLPADKATNLTLPASTYDIKATFNNNLDPGTVVSGVDVFVDIDPVDGGTADGVTAVGSGIAYPSVDGNILTITVASGQFKVNNLVTVTLDSTIADTDGNTLGSDYTWSFTTRYSPMYCTLRKIRLSIGAFIADVPDDTINFAIHMASLMADELTWNTNTIDTGYYEFVRQQWTCCKAEEIVLVNAVGGSGDLKAKQLGDLRVEYNTGNVNSNVALKRAMECQMRWEGALMAGGAQVQKAGMVVKGSKDPDRPAIGRGWVNIPGGTPAANLKVKHANVRRFRNMFSGRGTGWWK